MYTQYRLKIDLFSKNVRVYCLRNSGISTIIYIVSRTHCTWFNYTRYPDILIFYIYKIYVPRMHLISGMLG